MMKQFYKIMEKFRTKSHWHSQKMNLSRIVLFKIKYMKVILIK